MALPNDLSAESAPLFSPEAHKWEVGDRLREAISSAGFAINPLKTRMQSDLRATRRCDVLHRRQSGP